MHSTIAVVVEKIDNGFLVKLDTGIALYACGPVKTTFCETIADVAERLPQAFAELEADQAKRPRPRFGYRPSDKDVKDGDEFTMEA